MFGKESASEQRCAAGCKVTGRNTSHHGHRPGLLDSVSFSPCSFLAPKAVLRQTASLFADPDPHPHVLDILCTITYVNRDCVVSIDKVVDLILIVGRAADSPVAQADQSALAARKLVPDLDSSPFVSNTYKRIACVPDTPFTFHCSTWVRKIGRPSSITTREPLPSFAVNRTVRPGLLGVEKPPASASNAGKSKRRWHPASWKLP
jgi:hypothetical protein